MMFDPLGLEFEFVGTADNEKDRQSQVDMAWEQYNKAYEQASPSLRTQLDQYNSKEAGKIRIEIVQNDESVDFGLYKTSKVDLGDISKLPEKDAPMTQSAVFGHEIMEQAVKQTQGLSNSDADYRKAHAEGKKAEADLNGGWERRAPEYTEGPSLNYDAIYLRYYHQKETPQDGGGSIINYSVTEVVKKRSDGTVIDYNYYDNTYYDINNTEVY